MEFYEWDYTNGIARQYARHGTCNGCGACCLGEIHYIFQKRSAAEQLDVRAIGGGYATDGTEVWQEVRDGDLRIFRKFTAFKPTAAMCGELNGQQCRLHTIGKPLICQLWPISPRESLLFAQCSYTFTLVATWPIIEEVTEDGQ